MKKIYPVIFTKTESCILVEVPDLEILTEGRNLEEAVEMARDAIALTIVTLEDMGKVIPEPTKMKDINILNGTFADAGECFLSLVDADITEYRRKLDTKPVRRNVSLPGWLNYEAEKAGVNVSRILQEALMNGVGLERR